MLHKVRIDKNFKNYSMKKIFMSMLFAGTALFGQQIKFDEYTLPNGMHVILHQDNSAPVVTTGVMYHVGSKDEQIGKTGFAHFFNGSVSEDLVNHAIRPVITFKI